jgi:hypothetical protein
MFCGAAGVTKAHVFAKSWTKLFDDPSDRRDHEVVHHYTDPVTRRKTELKRAKTFALISRKVCGSCNSDWLRTIEDNVLPLMAAFASNTGVALDRNEQADLALWAAIAALLAMSLGPEEHRFAPASLARQIFRENHVPEGMEIWLGGNTHGHMGWFGSHSLIIPSARRPHDAWGASIAFGPGVIHMVCHGLTDQRIRLRSPANRSLRQIWPARPSVLWPPPLLIQQRDLRPLAEIVSEQGVFERAA